MILIVDYGMGNLRSVANALQAVGGEPEISSDPARLAAAERIILPGVGAFGEAMARLDERRLLGPLAEEVLGGGKPILGLCLGMQLLGDRSFEHGEFQGLGWIPGQVRRLVPADPHLRVPHIGWSSVTLTANATLFCDLGADPCFYFVHSYELVPDDRAAISATCAYGGEVVAAVARGHIFGTQFHPEKSHRAGLALLKNFLADAKSP